MKVQITLTTQDGTLFEGEVELSPVGNRRPRKSSRKSEPPKPVQTAVNFVINERAFIKQYARSLGGPKKFVLLTAFLVKGKVGQEIEVKEIQKHWNKMTAANLLGMEYNGFYSLKAKENGWVDTKKKGFYFLGPTWKEVLKP